MLTQAKEKLQAHALEATLAALGTAIPAWLLLAESRIAQHVSQLEPTTVIRVVAFLLVIALWATALLVFFRPRLKFDPRIGIYRDRKKGLYYCTSCHSKKLRSPLRENERGWRCNVKDCLMWYANPDYQEPPPPKQEDLGPHAWMAR